MNILKIGSLVASTAILSVGMISSSLAETLWIGKLDNRFNYFENWDDHFTGGDLVIDGAVNVEAPTDFTVGTEINSPNAPDHGPRSLIKSDAVASHLSLRLYS